MDDFVIGSSAEDVRALEGDNAKSRATESLMKESKALCANILQHFAQAGLIVFRSTIIDIYIFGHRFPISFDFFFLKPIVQVLREADFLLMVRRFPESKSGREAFDLFFGNDIQRFILGVELPLRYLHLLKAKLSLREVYFAYPSPYLAFEYLPSSCSNLLTQMSFEEIIKKHPKKIVLPNVSKIHFMGFFANSDLEPEAMKKLAKFVNETFPNLEEIFGNFYSLSLSHAKTREQMPMIERELFNEIPSTVGGEINFTGLCAPEIRIAPQIAEEEVTKSFFIHDDLSLSFLLYARPGIEAIINGADTTRE